MRNQRLTHANPTGTILNAPPGANERGCSSVVERQLPKLNVVGSTPITRSIH